MIEIFGVRLSDVLSESEAEARLIPAFHSAWKERHRGMKEGEARRASLVGLLLLQTSGVRGTLSYDTFGRPYLAESEVDFNITHTDKAVFCAIERETGSAPAPRVGIDAEEIGGRKPLRLSDMARRWFSEDEQAAFFADPTRKCFLRIWTRKEALIKWTGEGMRALSDANTENAEQTYGVHFQTYVEGDTVVTLCHRVDATPPPTIRMYRSDDFLQTEI